MKNSSINQALSLSQFGGNTPHFLESQIVDPNELLLKNLYDALQIILQTLSIDCVYLFHSSKGILATVSVAKGKLTINQENLNNLALVHQHLIVDSALPTQRQCHTSEGSNYLDSIKSIIAHPIGTSHFKRKSYIAGFSFYAKHRFQKNDMELLARFGPFLERHFELLTNLDITQTEKLQRIKNALLHENYVIYYQPIYQIKTGKLIGFEALTRFTILPHLSPAIWIQEAQDVGLSKELELAIIKKALKGLRQIPHDLILTLNVSPRHILTEDIYHVLPTSLYSRIVLEITEHESINNYDELSEKLEGLRESGLRIAIDDAGAGYSSFKHILNLKPDFIKLDMSITRDIDTDLSKSSLASAVVMFASETGCKVIAEGIETEAEWETLSKLGITGAQGFLIGKPLPIARALELAKPRIDPGS